MSQSHEQEKNQSNKHHVNRRHLLKKGAFFGGVSTLASALSLTPFSVHAAASASGPSTQVLPLSNAEIKQYIGLTLTSSHYQSFQQQQHSRLYQKFTLSEKEAEAVLVVNGTEKVVVVRIPIAGGAGHSFYSEQIAYGTSTVIGTMAGLFTTNSDQNVAAVVWKQGQEAINAVITPDGKQFLQGTVTSPSGQAQALNTDATAIDMGCWWNQMTTCLGWFTIPGWLLGIVASVCALACIATVGAGCIVCICSCIGASTTIVQYCNAVAFVNC